MICRIIAGDYEKCNLMIHQPFLKKEIIYICVGFNKKNWIKIDRETVDEYELITEERHGISHRRVIRIGFVENILRQPGKVIGHLG
jgi:hypothetical protein